MQQRQEGGSDQRAVESGQVAVVSQLALAEVDAEDGAGVDGLGYDPFAGKQLVESVGKTISQPVQVIAGFGRQFLEHRQAGRHGQGMGAESTALGKTAPRLAAVQEVHQVGPSPEGPDGETASHDLPEAGQVGIDSEYGLEPPRSRAEGDDLVEDEQDAVFPRDPPYCLRELGPDAQDPALGIENDAGQFVPVLHDEPLHRLFVVVGQDQDLIGHAGGTPPRPRNRVGRMGRTRLGQRRRDADFHRIMTAVIAPFELGDLRLPGEPAGQPNRVQGGFGS